MHPDVAQGNTFGEDTTRRDERLHLPSSRQLSLEPSQGVGSAAPRRIVQFPSADTSDEELTENSVRMAVHFSLPALISQPKHESHVVRIIRGVTGESARDHRSLMNDKKNIRLIVSS